MNVRNLKSLKKPLTEEELCDILIGWELIEEESFFDRDPIPIPWPKELEEAWNNYWKAAKGNTVSIWDYDCDDEENEGNEENTEDEEDWYAYEGEEPCNCGLKALANALFVSKYDIIDAMLKYLAEEEEEEDEPLSEYALDFLKELKEKGYIECSEED